LQRDVLYTDATPRQRAIANTFYVAAWLTFLLAAIALVAVAVRHGWLTAVGTVAGLLVLIWLWRRIVIALVEALLS
jgi:nicotinamide riboside transporter PnuC